MPTSRTRFIILWWPAVIWAALILVLSTIKPPEITTPEFFFSWDKIAHFFFYACLALFILRPLRHRPTPIPVVPAVLIAFLGASGYGIIIEVYQTFVGRETELADAAANTVGAMVASSVYFVGSLNKNRARREQSEQREHPRED